VLQAEASFNPARPSTFTDTAVDLAVGAGDGNRLLTVPLLPAGALDPATAYLVRIVVDQTVVTADHDPAFGITDGATFVGFMKGDADNAELGWAVLAAYGANLPATYPQISLGGPAANYPSFEILIRIEPRNGATANVFVAVRAGTAAGRHAFLATTFDHGAALSLAVFANHAAERYRFHGFDVTVSRDE
jgi:hypothetical protein